MIKILFICTHNRCRSILAEAITQQASKNQLQARSAGSQPSGTVHPLTLKHLSAAGINIKKLCSQSWSDYKAWGPDIVITVCDNAAKETCPLWLGEAINIHWGLTDPSSINGTDKEIADAFTATIKILQTRIHQFLEAQPHTLDHQALTQLLNRIGES